MTAEPVPTQMDLSRYVCERWRRYGHDRLYVRRTADLCAGGDRDEPVGIGYRDLKTGTDRPEAPEHAETLQTVVDAFLEQGATEPRRTIPAPPAPPQRAPAPVRPWLDLSLNPPGAAVRVQAIAKRSEAPVRTAVARLLGVNTDERAWRVGAKGESLVGNELQDLSRRNPVWTSIHSIPVGHRGADIDHLVIGPGGVFTLNTKHHPGADIWVGGETFMVNGHRAPYIRNARFEAERAARLLTAAVGFPLHVTALVVLVGCRTPITVKSQPRDVFAVTRRDLTRWLRGTGDILPQDALTAIWEMARRSTTWSG